MKSWRSWPPPIIAVALIGVGWLVFFPDQFRTGYEEPDTARQGAEELRGEHQPAIITDIDSATRGINTAPMDSAARLFSVNCASCHLRENRGQASLFSDLMNDDWQWGNSPAQIEHSIREGRNALMPPWLDSLSEDGVRQVAEYVVTLAAGGADDHPGRIQFDAFCVACHGVDAAGNPELGAPDLTDGVWLYGGSVEAITESISAGRQGVMPAFADRLDDGQIKLLVDYLTR